MRVDIPMSYLTKRESAIIENDHLVILTHKGAQDRVRRIFFDRVGSVLVYRELPLVRMIIFAFIFGFPGAAMILSGETGWVIVGFILASAFTVAELGYIVFRKTIIVVARDGENRHLPIIAFPGTVRSFITRLRINIENSQREAARRLRERIEGVATGTRS